MTVRRTVVIATVVLISGAAGLGAAAPAAAHGAPTKPMSRAFACTVGGQGATPACRAALAANGTDFGAFDNVRVPSVAGRDRQFIPDGQLCSASLPEWRGLDVARADWPATRLAAGRALSITYRATIAHRGTFRVYLTRAGYDPRRPLRWSDLDDRPLLTVTDPVLTAGVYRLPGRLPADRTGRHLLYTIWQNSDTPDTYYSCSDVDLTRVTAGVAPGGPASGAARPGRPGGARPAGPRPATTGQSTVPIPTGSADAAASPPPGGEGGTTGRESWLGPPEPIVSEPIGLGQQLVSAAIIVLFGVTAAVAYIRIRGARDAGSHRRQKDG